MFGEARVKLILFGKNKRRRRHAGFVKKQYGRYRPDYKARCVSLPTTSRGVNLPLTIRGNPYAVFGGGKGRAMYDFAPDTEIAASLVGLPVADVERDLILATLRETGGNRTHAAEILGLSVRTIRNKLKDYADQGYEIP